ncbi:hypothetical protein E4U59_003490 [Claviceps monticola]|nr:hypothetical protein E4U59_003443 [Claviceps monticola]KAG5948157.1 hypothetical protein E4U59_003490 [Claviceps monticola]
MEYFTNVRHLNPRQARWSQDLGGYSFVITYRSGKNNGNADMLPGLLQHEPEEGEVFRLADGT